MSHDIGEKASKDRRGVYIALSTLDRSFSQLTVDS